MRDVRPKQFLIFLLTASLLNAPFPGTAMVAQSKVQIGERSPSDVSFKVGELPPLVVGEHCTISLEKYVSGGNPPYHFVLDSGVGFPPVGLTLRQNGELSGTPKTEGVREFRVCAVDLSGSQSCQPITLDVKPKGTVIRKKRNGWAKAAVGAAAGAASGVGVYYGAKHLAKQAAGCGIRPVVPAFCRPGSSFPDLCPQDAVARARAYCGCLERGFDLATFINTGRCQ